jgi:tetratricopeptide (TPR) repeat protein
VSAFSVGKSHNPQRIVASPFTGFASLPYLQACLLLLMAALAYGPALRGGFVWDDDKYVTANPLLTAPDGLQRIWFSAHLQSQYFPLVFTTFRYERLWWGLNPLGYHLVNVLLHGLNALLVWLVLRRLKAPGAWFAAAIFALHPVNVESVAWITELKNVESMFFYLLALLAWMKFAEPKAPGSWTCYGLALGAYVLALFAKTTACTLPAALALVLWVRGERFGWRRAFQILPFVLWGLAMGLVSVWWEGQLGAGEGAEPPASLVQRMIIAGRALWFYAGKLLFPSHFCFSYPHWEINASDPAQFLPLFGCLLAGAGCWYWRRKIPRGAIAGMIFFVAALAPLLGFINEYTFRYTYVADHYQYTAAVGLIAVAAAGLRGALAWLGLTRPTALTFQAAVLAVLGGLTWQQCGVYRDSDTLWHDTLKKNPNSWMAHLNLGVDLFKRGRLDEALEHYQAAAALHPNGDTEQGNLGSALLEKGDYAGAIEHLKAASAINPNMYSVHNGLGLAYFNIGQPEQAVLHFRRALQLQPDASGIWLNLAKVLARQGKIDEALECGKKAVAVAPDRPEPLSRLGEMLLQAEQFGEAASVCRQALKLSPNRPDVLVNLGNALAAQTNYVGAVVAYRKALALEPGNAAYHYNLGSVLGVAGQIAEARQELLEALRIKKDFPQAQTQLLRLSLGLRNQ